MTPRSLLATGLSLLGIMIALPIHAATINSGDLIKTASHSDVYYYGPNAKRYAFPNEKTYFSWYTDFNTVTVSDTDLAAAQLGGAVTYRPGLRMVKVTTDPKVYAVAKGGTLRWIETEALAVQLYGADWAKKVDDVPDEFFATYKLGASIHLASDYSPTAELQAATSIAVDKGLVAPIAPTTTPPVIPPVSTSSSNVTLTVSKPSAHAGDLETLLGTASDTSGIVKIDLFFDGVLTKTCTGITSCSTEVQIPVSGTKTSYVATIVATALNTTTQTKTVTVTIVNDVSNLVTLIINRPVIRQNQAGEAIIQSDNSINILRTDIYLNGVSTKACASSAHQCAWSDILTGAVGTVYDFYGVVSDNLGQKFTTAHKTITISTNDLPVVTTAASKSTIFVGESVDITVSASDDDGISGISVLKDGAIIKTCVGAVPCTVQTGLWMNAGTLTFSGRATDSLNATASSDSQTVTVQ